MAAFPLNRSQWQLVVPASLYSKLISHLFPGDNDEHGAVITAGTHVLPDGRVRLLARELHLAVDGQDYLPSTRGYRRLRAEFITKHIVPCRDEGLAYLAVHNHGGNDSVEFSTDDIRSHERGYPALLDVVNGPPVGGLVLARSAAAGDIWLPGCERVSLQSVTVVGRQRRILQSRPTASSFYGPAIYDRQARLFGETGQDILRTSKVGIVGLGGVGSLLAEFLGHLGVGSFVLIDPDRLEPSNIPRVAGASFWLARTWLRKRWLPASIGRLAQRLSVPKVALARRGIARVNPSASVVAIHGDVLEPANAAHLLGCDYIFLAADTMRARLLFNQIVHQYLIPGVQVGSKVGTAENGDVTSVFSVVRPVAPDKGCLWCNGLINRTKLQAESQTREERKAQRYVDEPEIVAPSVVTLNAVGAAHAANDFLFYMTGLSNGLASQDYFRHDPQTRCSWLDEPRKDELCPECGHTPRSRLARGDARTLNTRRASANHYNGEARY